eukprot:788811-Rhodomonas_salina.7
MRHGMDKQYQQSFRYSCPLLTYATGADVRYLLCAGTELEYLPTARSARQTSESKTACTALV